MQPKMSLQIVSPPAAEPVDLQEMKDHLRIDHTYEDEIIRSYLSAARERCEVESRGTVAVATTYRASFDRFPLMTYGQNVPGSPVVEPVINDTWPLSPGQWALKLPRGPMLSLTSVRYYDAAGTLQTMSLSSLIADTQSEPPRVTPAQGAYWPASQFRPGAVQVDFVAGYSAPITLSGDTFTARGRTFANNDTLRLWNSGGALPSGTDSTTTYYVVNASGSTFKLSTSEGGASLTPSDSGQGTHFAGIYPPGNTPASLRVAIKLLAAHWYENREAVSVTPLTPLPMGVEALLATVTNGNYW